MKTLICTLNSKYIHSSLAPWNLFTACKAYCEKEHDINVLEFTLNSKQADILQKILCQKPDLITFSCYIWNKTATIELCKQIKAEIPDVIIALGGPEVAYNQREILQQYDFVDFVLSGEGEIILPRLLDCLQKNDTPNDIDGISFRRENTIVIKNEAISPTFDFPSPYCEEYLNALNGRITYIESSRGCPFSCAYCLSGRCGKVKFKSIEQTKSEILTLASSGTKTVKFIDRTFNCDNNRAVEILRFINESYGSTIPEGVCFHFEISADIIKDSFLEEISKAKKGTFQFELGIQSMNTDTLTAIGRRSNLDRLCENIKKLTALRNYHIHTDLIAGLPHETLQSFTEGFNKSYTLGADMLQLGFLKLLHGSPMRENKEQFPCRFSSEPPYEVISTPTMSEDDLGLLKAAEKEVDRLHNSGRFRRTLTYTLEISGLTPFELFLFIGKELEKKLPAHGVSLDRYTDALFDALCGIDKISPDVLRDKMITDRIATNNSGIIPKRLCISDKRLKKIKHTLSLTHPMQKGINRSVAILYTEKRVVFCDYKESDSVTNEYPLQNADFDFFGETFFDFDIDK